MWQWSARASKVATWAWCWCAWPRTWRSGRRSSPSWWALRCTRPSCRWWRYVIVLFLVGYVVPQVAAGVCRNKHALPWLTRAMIAGQRLGAGLRLVGRAGAGGAPPAHARWSAPRRCGARALRRRLAEPAGAGQAGAPATTRRVLPAPCPCCAPQGCRFCRPCRLPRDTLGNQARRRDALDALVLVREGAPLASALAQKKRFPGLLSMFARLGEQTGQLPEMLERAAQPAQHRSAAPRPGLGYGAESRSLIVAMGLVVDADRAGGADAHHRAPPVGRRGPVRTGGVSTMGCGSKSRAHRAGCMRRPRTAYVRCARGIIAA